MPQVQLAEDLYNDAQRRALEDGYDSVDYFISAMLTENLRDEAEPENFDDRFTPEVIAHLDRISAEMQAGGTYTAEQLDEHLKNTREEWLRNHPK